MVKGFNRKLRLAASLRVAAWCALAVLFFNPFGLFLSPVMPYSNLDGSWVYSINHAVAKRMEFGRDIVFTVGPYGSVYTHADDPATTGIMVAGSLLLDLCYTCSFVLLVRRAHWPWPLILAALLIASLITPDAFLFSFLLLQVVLVFRLQDEEMDGAGKRVTLLLLALLFACSGMLPLIKGSLAPMELCLYVPCFFLLTLRRQWMAALICFLAPLAAMMLFWFAAGQRIADLPSYFSELVPIISGYSDAMSVPGPSWEVLLFLIGALAILAAIVLARQFDPQRKTLLLLAYAFYLFIDFKAGFARQDDLHVSHALGALALSALWLTLLETPRQKRFNSFLCLSAFVVAILPFGFFWHNYFVDAFRVNGKVPKVYKELKGRALFARLRSDLGYTGLVKVAFVTEPHVGALHPWTYSLKPWRDRFDDARREINASSRLNFVLPGSVDVYSYEQSALLSRGYAWDPRPVMQSYSAYTPRLIRCNEQHLRGSGAPGNIVFRLETIDDRLPTLDDGLSWPAMLDNYRVAEVTNDWVLLARNPGPLREESHFTLLGTTSARLGQDVTMQAANGPIFVQINLNPGAFGRFLGALDKLPLLRLTVTSGDGHTASYRVIAGMMKTGFFLSPLVTSNEDFARLFNPSEPLRDDEKIRTLRLDAEGRGWNDSYTIAFHQYEY